MQIKRFRASDMSSALKMIKQEFGPEAVILSVRDLEKARGFFGIMEKGGLEVTAAIDAPFSEAGAKQPEGEPSPRIPRRSPVSVALSGAGKSRAAAPRAASAADMPPARKFPHFHRRLIDHGVRESIVLEILGKIDNMANGAHSPKDRLAQGMTRILREKGVRPLALSPEAGKQKRVSFIGLSGVGKTTTIAKLCGFHSIRGRDVAVIALEDDRICALRKMEIFSKIINVPMEVAAGSDGVQRALRRFRNKEIIYIDTPGISFRDDASIGRVREYAGGVPGVHNQLLVSAAAKERDIAELVRRFDGLPIHGLAVTKMDESLSYGDLLNYLYQSPMPVSYVTDGQRIPEDIRPASPQLLAGLFIGQEAEALPEDPAAPALVPPKEAPETAAEDAEDPDAEDPFEGLRYYGGGM